MTCVASQASMPLTAAKYVKEESQTHRLKRHGEDLKRDRGFPGVSSVCAIWSKMKESLRLRYLPKYLRALGVTGRGMHAAHALLCDLSVCMHWAWFSASVCCSDCQVKNESHAQD